MKSRIVHAFTLTLLLMNRGESLMAQNIEKGIVNVLTSLGFENVCALWSNDTLRLAYENNIYRWNVRGLKVVIDTVINRVPAGTNLEIITLKNAIPLFKTMISAEDWHRYRQDSLTYEQFSEKMKLTNDVGKSWELLKGEKMSNLHYAKFDFVVYPLFSIMNIHFYALYEVQFSLAPSVEFSLWKGNKFTGQVIIPIYGDKAYDDNYVRPGFITVSQEFRTPGPFFGRVTLGMFDRYRQGIDLALRHPFKNDHWSAGFNGGYTGLYYRNKLNNDTWTFVMNYSVYYLLNVGYFFKPFNLQVNLRGGRFLYKDYGARIDITRYFGDTNVGFYATYTQGAKDAGFHFTAPLPPGKRGRRHRVRVLPPKYYEFSYSAGTEFIKGKSYSTRPDENGSNFFYNLIYLQNSLY